MAAEDDAERGCKKRGGAQVEEDLIPARVLKERHGAAAGVWIHSALFPLVAGVLVLTSPLRPSIRTLVLRWNRRPPLSGPSLLSLASPVQEGVHVLSDGEACSEWQTKVENEQNEPQEERGKPTERSTPTRRTGAAVKRKQKTLFFLIFLPLWLELLLVYALMIPFSIFVSAKN